MKFINQKGRMMKKTKYMMAISCALMFATPAFADNITLDVLTPNELSVLTDQQLSDVKTGALDHKNLVDDYVQDINQEEFSRSPILNVFVNPQGFDDYDLPDKDFVTGDVSASGHSYRVTGVNRQYIKDRVYRSAALGRAAILYMELPSDATEIGGKFQFLDQTQSSGPPRDHGENAVIGVAEVGFGSGSIQLGIWRDEWQLFAVQNPIVDPYPIIGSGTFDNVLQTGVDYQFSITRTANDTVVVNAPEGKTAVITHPFIAEYWGSRFGVQMRRPASTDGRVLFTYSAAKY